MPNFKHPQAASIIKSAASPRLWIVSGGQTGVDRTAMEFALHYRLPVRGWCPLGRAAEDGTIPTHIPVQESNDSDPALRTELNAYDSDATLILTYPEVRDGTVLTEECTKEFSKPLLVFMLNESPTSEDKEKFLQWIKLNKIRVLNIAGPRESFSPGKVSRDTLKWLTVLFLETE